MCSIASRRLMVCGSKAFVYRPRLKKHLISMEELLF